MSFFNHPMLSFLRNGVQTPVLKDTVTPANSRPLPVELMGATGDVAINATNLHLEVQLSDGGTDPDVVRIGDGTDELAINADGSINVLASIGGASTPTIQVLTVAIANTEQSYAFPANTKQFKLQTRSGGKIKYSFSAGTSGTNYLTLWPGSFNSEDGLDVTGLSVYYQSPVVGSVVEVLSWS